MQQAIQSTYIYKCTIVCDIFDDTSSDIPNLNLIQQYFALFLALFLNQFSPRKNDILPLLIYFHYLKFVGIAYILVQVYR